MTGNLAFLQFRNKKEIAFKLAQLGFEQTIKLNDKLIRLLSSGKQSSN